MKYQKHLKPEIKTFVFSVSDPSGSHLRFDNKIQVEGVESVEVVEVVEVVEGGY